MGTKKTATLIDFTVDAAVATWVYRLEPPYGDHAQIAVCSRAGSTEILVWPSRERILAMVPGYGDPEKALAMWQGYAVPGSEGDGEVTIFSRADAEPAETDEQPKPRRRKKEGEDGEG
jgi:hypothetical protein